jgi:hypothetical protein
LLKRLPVCAPAHKAEDSEKNHRILNPEKWRRSSCSAYQRSDNQYHRYCYDDHSRQESQYDLPVTSTGGGSARDWNFEPIDGIERRSLLTLVGVVIEIERPSLSVILAVNLEHRDRECPIFNSKPHLQAKVLIAFTG